MFFVLYSVIALLQYLMLVCTVSFLFEDLLEDRPLQAEGAILHKIKITYIHSLYVAAYFVCMMLEMNFSSR